jgi:hypothetical protein
MIPQVFAPRKSDTTPLAQPAPAPPDNKSHEFARSEVGRHFDSAAEPGPAVATPLPFTLRAPALDQTQHLKAHQRAVREGRAGPLPKRATRYKYLFVGGFSWDSLPDYFGPNIRRLRSLGLDAEFVPTDPLGTNEENGRKIAAAVNVSRKQGKRVVIVPHSAAANHTVRGLLDDPTAQGNVLAIVPIQSPFHGTAAADWARRHPWLYATAMLYSRLISPARVLATNPFFRRETVEQLGRGLGFAERPPLRRGIRFYSVVSRVSSDTSVKLLLWITAGAVKALSGRDNDGIVSPEDGIVPGHPFAFLEHVGHIDTVSDSSGWKSRTLGVRGQDKNFAADLSEAIVRWIFERKRG